MTPDVSRACARIVGEMHLVPGRVFDELMVAGELAETVDGLPLWARNALALGPRAEPEPQTQVDELAGVDMTDQTAGLAVRMLGDVEAPRIAPPPPDTPPAR